MVAGVPLEDHLEKHLVEQCRGIRYYFERTGFSALCSRIRDST